MEDHAGNGWRLYKANLSAERRIPEAKYVLETQPTETIVSAQLLELVNREGVRRFVIHAGQTSGILVRVPFRNNSCETNSDFPLSKLWTFNPDIRYSSSSVDHSVIAKRAMKVFYQDVADVETLLEPEKGTPLPISLEELFLPVSIWNELISSLHDSNKMLPMSARVFREWKIGFLCRFERT
jgi:hypothetical protein